jgi:peptidoglycan/LPS O-acetylase OafA/YrhL
LPSESPEVSPARLLSSADRLPTLDGVRGLAILLVVVNNLYPEKPSIWFDRLVESASNTGWIGVDLFFVLSGFLITGILLDTKGQAHYFRNFYARRFLRIFPLYYGLVLVIVLLANWTSIGTLDERSRFLERQGWFWTYTVNLLMSWKGAGAAKFGTGAFWSLAVEEQFYLVWPLLVLLLSRRRLVALCLAMILGALALRIGWRHADLTPDAMYMMTPARMDALAVGALLALSARNPAAIDAVARWSRPVLGATGSVLVALMLWRQGLGGEDVAVQTAGYTIVALMFGGLMGWVLTADRGDRIARAFGTPALRSLGRYSYGLYVFHGPVIVLLERNVPLVRDLPTLFGSHVPSALAVLLVASSVSLGLAVISWHGYEKWFLRLKHRFPYAQDRDPTTRAA